VEDRRPRAAPGGCAEAADRRCGQPRAGRVLHAPVVGHCSCPPFASLSRGRLFTCPSCWSFVAPFRRSAWVSSWRLFTCPSCWSFVAPLNRSGRLASGLAGRSHAPVAGHSWLPSIRSGRGRQVLLAVHMPQLLVIRGSPPSGLVAVVVRPLLAVHMPQLLVIRAHLHKCRSNGPGGVAEMATEGAQMPGNGRFVQVRPALDDRPAPASRGRAYRNDQPTKRRKTSFPVRPTRKAS
jgi:hypothetical protein